MAGLNLDGKNILVTGAGRGIGRAIAIALAKQGIKVYALSRTRSTLESLVKEQPSIVPIVTDLTDWESTRQKLERLEPMDGLVNNAGIFEVDPALTISKEKIDKVMNTNLIGAVNCTQVIAGKMVKEGKSGSIVNISSNSSLVAPSEGILAYAMSKAAMDAATRQFALELGPHKIRVNSVNLTSVLGTDMTDGFFKTFPGRKEQMENKSPMKRVLELNDVIGPVLYFLSDLSSMVTGTCNIVDGGTLNCPLY